MKTFLRGLIIPEFKEQTEKLPIIEAVTPQKVLIPLRQHTGAACAPLVKVGDEVSIGQKIGEATGYVSAPVHASISGKVTKIESVYHPCGGQLLSIGINGEENREQRIENREQRSLESLTPDEIRSIVKEAGIVGLGGAAFPTHVKLNPPKDKPIDTVIINGCECEPFITADHRIMLERAEDVIFGAKAVAKAVSAKRIIVGVEANKADAIAALRAVVRTQPLEFLTEFGVVRLPVKYPQGGERQLSKSLLGREVPSGGLPMDCGCVVQNVSTCVAIAEAIHFNQPLIERVVTVTGSGVKKPANLRARIGVSFGELINQCNGLTDDAAKIIMGGPLTGIAVSSLEVPVVKATTGILILSKKDAREYEERACIRCGRCIKTCPAGLAPNFIADYAKAKAWSKTEEYQVADCIECSACAYVCPSRIYLVHYFKTAKRELNLRKSICK